MAGTPSIEEVIEDFNVLKCMQCGVCSGSCPSGRQASLNIRRLVRKIGKDHTAISDETLWMCTTCYNCQERCPRGIAIVDAILAVRSIAAHEGLILERHKHVANLLQEHGHAVPIDDTHREKRMQLGLNSLPSTVHSHPDALKDVKRLLASCDFGEITGGEEQ